MSRPVPTPCLHSRAGNSALGATGAALLLLLASGCTSPRSAAVDGGDGNSVEPDGPTAVWKTKDTGFVYRTSGGGELDPFPEDGCHQHDVTITFTAPDSLVSEGCSYGVSADWNVTLSDDEELELLVKLTALRTTDREDCGADAPWERLTVYGEAGAARLYEGQFYAGCESATNSEAIGVVDFRGSEARDLLQFLQSLQPASDAGG